MKNKSIDKTAVLVAAATLMLKNSTTTTLEVKNELRKQGFEARQSEVSDLMTQLGAEENWDVQNAGAYKVYGPGSTSGLASTSTTPSTKTPSTTVVLTTKVSGCWEMNSTTSTKVVYVNGSLSREKARTAYMNEVAGTAWADTRGRKVK